MQERYSETFALPKDAGKSLLRKMLLSVLSLLLVLSVALAGGFGKQTQVAYGAPAPGDQTLTIIHTNDVHGNVDVLPYVKGLKDKLEAEGKEVLVVSAGDDYAGTSFASFSKGKDITTAMNMVGYDMSTIGNHELLMSLADYKAALETANYTILGCNAPATMRTEIPAIKNYQIVEKFGVKIAFIGISSTLHPNYTDAPDMLSSVNAAKDAAAAEGATVFVGVSHLGMNPGDVQNSQYLADNCAWMTAIIDGHSHTILDNGQLQNGVLIAQTGEYGNNIGVMEITVNAGAVVDKTASLTPIKGHEATCGISPDTDTQDFIATVNAKIAIANEVLFELPVMLNGDRESSRTKETNFGNFVTDAMRAQGGTDIAFTSGASLRNDVGPGEIGRMFLESSLLADTRLAIVEISGAQVLEVIETGLAEYPAQNYLFPHLSGLKIRFDPDKPAMSRVSDAILLDGSRLDLAKTYTCTVREDIAEVYIGANAKANGDYTTASKSLVDAVADYANNSMLKTSATAPTGVGVSGKTDGRIQPMGNTFVVNFDNNAGDSGKRELIVFKDVAVGADMFVSPNREGYIFKSWNTLADGTGVTFTADTVVGADTTVYAQWVKVSSGGSTSTKPPSKLPATGDFGSVVIMLGLVLMLAGFLAITISRRKVRSK